MRLIDANDLVSEIDVTPYSISAASERENILELIELAPTIDAAPVVRCEQCAALEMNAKLFEEHNDEFGEYWCHELDRDVFLINFCGLGKRAEGAK